MSIKINTEGIKEEGLRLLLKVCFLSGAYTVERISNDYNISELAIFVYLQMFEAEGWVFDKENGKGIQVYRVGDPDEVFDVRLYHLE